jgi:ATP phosphoribosyltransferase regulatory subunit
MDTMQDISQYLTTRNALYDRLQDLAKREGFLQVRSDYLEDFIDYFRQNTRQDPKRLVKVQDNTGRLFVLQPDITTNIIKQVMPRLEGNDVAKLFYLDDVFAVGSDGRIRTTRQFGVEMIGVRDADADVALIRLIDRVFADLGLELVLEVGNQKWIERVLRGLGLSPSRLPLLRKAVIAKNRDEAIALLEGANPSYRRLLELVLATERDLTTYRSLIEEQGLDPDLLVEMDRIQAIQEANDNVVIDLSLIQPFDYYNGPIFKGYLNRRPTDVVRGGRYDTLTEDYGDRTPALGFSLDVDILVNEVMNRG